MDEELLRLWATHRNREAADRLIRRHERALYAFACRLARNESEASEIVQETCLRLLQKASEFQGRSSLRTWIFGIAVNVARSRRFRLQKLRALFRPIEAVNYEAVEEQPMNDAESRKTQHEIFAKVDAALAELPRESRVPILLHYYQGFDYEQMAEILGCPSGTVASRLHAARKKLETKLRHSGVDLAAFGSLEMLREGGSAPIPATLHQSLRALPQKALIPTLAAPVTGLGALVAGSLAAVALLGSAFLLHAEATSSHPLPEWLSTPPLRAVVAARPASAFRRTEMALRERETSCEDRIAREKLWGATATVSAARKSRAAASPSASLNLRVTGTLRDAQRGISEGCAPIVLRAVWPPRPLETQVDPFLVATAKTNADGFFALEAAGLAEGIYEISVEQPFVLPQFFALRESATQHHDFLRLQADEEERNALLHAYRNDLSRALESFFLGTGQSALRLRLMETESSEPQAFAIRENGGRVEPGLAEPMARVFDPIGNNLLMGPLPPGDWRIEVLQPGKGSAVLPSVRIGEREIAEASLALVPAEDFFSVEVLDGAGRPVAGARVELQASDLWIALPFTVGMTDAQGHACFDGVPCRVNVLVQPPAAPGIATVPCKIHCGQAASGTTLRVVID